MPTLVVLRHAKSDYPLGVPDHDRPLSGRGVRQAPLAGQWISSNLTAPGMVLVSTALRTRQTWELVAQELPIYPKPQFEPRIYEASVTTLVGLIHESDPSVEVALLIGHNPGLEDLVLTLTNNPASVPAIEVGEKFPTSAIAVLRFEGPWSDVGARSAELEHFVIPR